MVLLPDACPATFPRMGRIHDTLADLVEPMDRMTVHPENPNDGDVGAIAGSLLVNKQYRPIVANRRCKHIVGGNHTYLAAKSLGWNEMAVTWIDVDEETCVRILLADNRYAQLSSYLDDRLVALLGDLAATERGLDGTGWDGDDLDDLIARVEADFDPLGEGTEGRLDRTEEKECPYCHATWVDTASGPERVT